MHVLSHRGLASAAPENSLAAFREALRRGFGLEVDLRLTADGRLVVHHDRNVQRTLDVDRVVADLTLSELNELRARAPDGAGVLPTLAAVLDLFEAEAPSDAKLALHLKDTDQLEAVSELVAALSDAGESDDPFRRTFVFDVTLDTARRIKERAPAVRIGLSIGESERFPTDERPTIYTYEDVADHDCWDIVWADEWRGSLYTADFVDRCRDDDRPIVCVSPELHSTTEPPHPKADSPVEVWRRLRRLGVDGICTDRPTELAEIMP